MNWTGGSLQRHSKGNDPVRQRQRQYFAKARSKRIQGNGNPTSPPSFCPSFLKASDCLPEEVVLRPCSKHHYSGSKSGRQRRLEEYQDIAPLAARLSSMKPRSLRPCHTRQSSEEAGCLGEAGYESTVAEGSSRRNARQRSDKYSRMSEEHKDKPNGTNLERRSSDYNSRRNKRPQTENSPINDDVESSRRRLLERSDWIGIRPTRPLHMQFTSRDEKNKIGKRRKLTYGRRPLLADQDHWNRPFQQQTISSIRHHGNGSSGSVDSNKGPGRIHIHLGIDALESQISGFRNSSQSFKESQPISSDSMLLDAEVGPSSVGNELIQSSRTTYEKYSYNTNYPRDRNCPLDSDLQQQLSERNFWERNAYSLDRMTANRPNSAETMFLLESEPPSRPGSGETLESNVSTRRVVLPSTKIVTNCQGRGLFISPRPSLPAFEPSLALGPEIRNASEIDTKGSSASHEDLGGVISDSRQQRGPETLDEISWRTMMGVLEGTSSAGDMVQTYASPEQLNKSGYHRKQATRGGVRTAIAGISPLLAYPSLSKPRAGLTTSNLIPSNTVAKAPLDNPPTISVIARAPHRHGARPDDPDALWKKFVFGDEDCDSGSEAAQPKSGRNHGESSISLAPLSHGSKTSAGEATHPGSAGLHPRPVRRSHEAHAAPDIPSAVSSLDNRYQPRNPGPASESMKVAPSSSCSPTTPMQLEDRSREWMASTDMCNIKILPEIVRR
ncbi:hypothetical protein BDY21DRAFT_10446 [Lineolata rhizophorae]|uniref:Uncharacterized protein n=1 Tax=Lineolata rhizophorae TaxID=578093 RepID=A0A6A6PET2_9PEZI|nr:hypothetical protein BDY21DRAFT_10446 [Lineolata rhizophorae]